MAAVGDYFPACSITAEKVREKQKRISFLADHTIDPVIGYREIDILPVRFRLYIFTFFAFFSRNSSGLDVEDVDGILCRVISGTLLV